MTSAIWKFADWTNPTLFPGDRERLEQLALHIEEVTQYILTMERKDRKSSLPPSYLENLHTEERKLRETVRQQNILSGAARLRKTRIRFG